MDSLVNLLNSISGFLSGNLFMFVILGTGIGFTILFGFPQFRHIADAFRLAFAKPADEENGEKGVSSWRSLATAVAGQVGTGNIAGPATAIMSGGPGAVFWVWVAAILGQGTIMAEAIAAQRYKTTLSDGTVVGGPAYYINAAFPNKFGKVLGSAFSVVFLIGFSISAAMVQGNTVADSFRTSFNIPLIVTGLIVAAILMLVALGGVSRITSVTSSLVPVMAVVYIVCAVIVLIKYGGNLIPALGAIFRCAFSGKAVWGGFVGISVREAMRYGIMRGLFSNEAGEGTTPHAHAIAKVKHPCDQGLVAMVSIVIDSLIILTLSSLVILASGAYKTEEPGIGVVTKAFENTFGKAGLVIIAFCIFCFCFSTILAAYFYGLQNIRKLVNSRKFDIPYIVVMVGMCIFGTVLPVPLVWAICDVLNGCMVFINVIGLWGCAPELRRLWKEYREGGTELDTTLNDIKRRKAQSKTKA